MAVHAVQCMKVKLQVLGALTCMLNMACDSDPQFANSDISASNPSMIMQSSKNSTAKQVSSSLRKLSKAKTTKQCHRSRSDTAG